MSPKQEAQRLVDKFSKQLNFTAAYSTEKACASACAEELMNNSDEDLKDFWADVIAEIEIL